MGTREFVELEPGEHGSATIISACPSRSWVCDCALLPHRCLPASSSPRATGRRLQRDYASSSSGTGGHGVCLCAVRCWIWMDGARYPWRALADAVVELPWRCLPSATR
jgi:hypothetical protein